MADYLHQTNFAASTLAAQLLIDGTDLQVVEGEGLLFPHDATADHFPVVIWDAAFTNPSDDPTREIVHAHYASADHFLIVRAQEGTSAKQWEIGDKVALVLTAAKLGELETEIDLKAPSVSPSFTTPALGTPSSGTLTNCAGLPAAGIVPGTAESDFLIATTTPFTWIKKTLAEAKTILNSILTQTAEAVGFTIAGGTTSRTLTVDETVALSAKAPKTDTMKGDGTAGRVVRRSYLSISNGTNAATINVSLVNVWNGDAAGPEDNLGKPATGTYFDLDAAGSVLTLKDAAISGTVITTFNAIITGNWSGVLMAVDFYVAGSGIAFSFTNPATGAALDLTALVDTGLTYVSLMYLTSA